jgi:hypothetical protein
VTGTKSLAFRLNKKDMDWRRGDYRAVILVNGKEAASQDFKIRFSMAEGKQVPIVRLFGFMPDKVEEGQASVLWWFVEDGQGVEIAGLGPVGTQGYKIMAPGESCRYTLTASNAEGTITANAALTVSKPAAGDKPDLVITAFETDGTNVTCTVKNIGGAACGPLDVIISFIKENRYSPLAKCTGLAPGEEQKLTFPGYAWPLKAHTWIVPFTVCVNALDASAEANTQNNCLTLIW